jgi:hypothetical protein
MQWQGCEIVTDKGVCTRPAVATVQDLRRPNAASFRVCAHHAAQKVTQDREGGKPRYRVEKDR